MNIVRRIIKRTSSRREVEDEIPATVTSEERFEILSGTKWSLNVHEEYIGAFVRFCEKSKNPRTAGLAKLIHHIMANKTKLKLTDDEMIAMEKIQIDGLASLLKANEPAEISSIKTDLFNLLTINAFDDFIKSETFTKCNRRVAQLDFLHNSGFI